MNKNINEKIDKNKTGEKITRLEFLAFMSEYWSQLLHNKVTVKDDLSINYLANGRAIPIWHLYYVVESTNKRVALSKTEVEYSIQMLCELKGYKMETFNILGGVRLAENNRWQRKDKPVIEGIYLYYNGLNNKNIKK